MSGYTRQSTADIIPTATVRAAPLNAEYNALRDAFAASGGHKHDGATGEGDYVPLIADADAKNKVQVNTSANTVDFYVEVSSVPVEQISIRDGVIRPITDNDIDLGATGAEFKDLYIDGIGYIDTLAVHENATVAGTLNVTGVITAPAGVVANLTGNVTGNLTGNVTGALTGDVTSTGTSTFADLDAVDLSATGTTVITSGDINSGTIDNSVIGNATPAAGTFTTLTANTSLTAATADINGGTLDGVIIGAGTAAAATVTDLTATGTSTLSTVDINAGAIDGTAIGASVPSTGAFTTVSTTGQATLASADINGGAIDGTTIGASVPATGTFTTVSASGGVTSNVTGNLTGNVTGNVTGAITGNVTGDLTGNVTSAGSSSFNNVTIDGTLNMNAGTTSTITNLTSPTNANDAATKGYVDQEVSALVDSAPGTLDTLNELAAALGDDADFSTTVTNSIATKLPLAGGTMSGEIAMGSNKITGVTDPTGGQDASTKAYTDAQRDTRVAKVGDTMSGNLAMGANKVTGLAAPTDNADAATKAYVDTTNASNAAAATSATNAATSETNAATSETNAATSETNAGNSATAAAASYDSFDDRYLGAKSAAPTVDNDGDALITGALYFNSTSNIMYVYSGAGWQAAGSSVNGTSDRQAYTATAGQTVFAAAYDTGYIDVYLNGIKLAPADFTATNGTSVTLTSGAAVNDILETVAYGTFVLADHYTEAQSDARYLGLAGGTMTGDIDGNGNKVLFGNVYSQLSDLPSASTYHGMFAHVHATGKGYFAHAGAWVPLANETATLALSGGAMTGAITTNSTFDGRDVATDGTKLDGIEASADVTDTVNVVAALTAGSNITIAANGTIAGAAQYTHPTHAGDDAAIDTGALSGATVISDLDLNITTDTLGHVTDANATVATRNLTLANLGYTGATDATNDTTANAALPKAGGAVTGNVTFGDSNKIVMGSGSDLSIYHDGSASRIHDNGTGNLILSATDFQMNNGANNETMFTAVSGGAVTLKHSGNSKLATTASGIDVTGTVNADALTGIGSIDATTAAAITAGGVGGGEDYFTISTTGYNGNVFPTVTGDFSLCIGSSAVVAAQKGTAVGSFAKAIATGDTSFGHNAGQNNANTLGSTSIGEGAKCSSSGAYGASGTVAVGKFAKVDGGSDVEGGIAIGASADSGSRGAIAIGRSSVSDTYGTVAIGEYSRCDGGMIGSVAIGRGARVQNSTAKGGIAIGGSQYVGVQHSSSAGAQSYSSGINIGNIGSSATNNTIRIGTSSHTTVQVGNTSSDSRDKVEIEDLTLGLEFINKLSTKSFVYNNRDRYEDWDNVGKTDEKDAFVTTGIIAQEVLAVLNEVGFDKEHNIIKDIEKNKDGYESEHEAYIVKMDQFIAPLMKAVQELSAKNEALETRLALLEV